MSEMMTPVSDNRGKKVFTKIVNGTFRVKADENTPNAIYREYVNQSTGSKESVWETHFKRISGYIVNVSFETINTGGKAFNLWKITLKEKKEGKEVVISLSYGSSYATDFLKKLPNVNAFYPVTLTPYAFEDEESKKKLIGISVVQGEKKIQNFFFDYNTKSVLYGMPVAQGSKAYDSDDWQIFFKQVDKFLKNYIITNVVPKYEGFDVFAEIENASKPTPETRRVYNASNLPPETNGNEQDDLPF